MKIAALSILIAFPPPALAWSACHVSSAAAGTYASFDLKPCGPNPAPGFCVIATLRNGQAIMDRVSGDATEQFYQGDRFRVRVETTCFGSDCTKLFHYSLVSSGEHLATCRD